MKRQLFRLQPKRSAAPSAAAVTPHRGIRLPQTTPQQMRVNWLMRPINDAGNTVSHLMRLIAFGITLFCVLGSLVIPWRLRESARLGAGTVATTTVKSPQTLTYTSDVRTQERRDEVANDDRLRVYKLNTSLIVAQRNQFDAAIRQAAELRATGNSSLADRGRTLQGQIPDLSSDDATKILQISTDRWDVITNAARSLFDSTMTQTISIEQLAQVKDNLPNRVDNGLSTDERTVVVALARPYVRANQTEDVDETARRREQARAGVRPIMVTVQEGQTIVRDGDIVSADQREMMEKLDILTPKIQWTGPLGVLGLVALLVTLLTVYLYRFERDLWRSSQLLLFGLIIVLPCIAARLTLADHPTWIYAFPIALSATLTVVLMNLQFATVVALVTSLMIGLLGPGHTSLEFASLAFGAGFVGAFVLWKADRIATFLWAGVLIATITTLIGVCFRLLANTLDAATLLQIALLAAFNGVLTSVLTFGSFTFLGSLFGITTHLQLLELAHPNQPLLYRLAREAPGTYHHSIVVSNLAESAIERVGGDPLFTRVAVLYHDIGKTLRPTFFIENQANRDNVHDELEPLQSARIIIDHVTDGVRLAQKARLPESIIDVIRQHHGTTQIRYFYNKAVAQGEEVQEADFCYPGPKPQTKEAGVIMLADSVEAAVRATAQSGKLDFTEHPGQTKGNGATALRQPKNSKLQQVVYQVIDDRVRSGQLNECALTLRDIEQIKQTFVQVLEGIYHPRIDYPPAQITAKATPAPVPATIQ